MTARSGSELTAVLRTWVGERRVPGAVRSKRASSMFASTLSRPRGHSSASCGARTPEHRAGTLSHGATAWSLVVQMAARRGVGRVASRGAMEGRRPRRRAERRSHACESRRGAVANAHELAAAAAHVGWRGRVRGCGAKRGDLGSGSSFVEENRKSAPSSPSARASRALASTPAHPRSRPRRAGARTRLHRAGTRVRGICHRHDDCRDVVAYRADRIAVVTSYVPRRSPS